MTGAGVRAELESAEFHERRLRQIDSANDAELHHRTSGTNSIRAFSASIDASIARSAAGPVSARLNTCLSSPPRVTVVVVQAPSRICGSSYCSFTVSYTHLTLPSASRNQRAFPLGFALRFGEAGCIALRDSSSSSRSHWRSAASGGQSRIDGGYTRW